MVDVDKLLILSEHLKEGIFSYLDHTHIGMFTSERWAHVMSRFTL
jgi:hypothetical protein